MEKEYVVILFYKFTDIEEPKSLAEAHRAIGQKLDLKGRVLVAKEGINATLEGIRSNIDKYKKFLNSDPIFADVVVKESLGTGRSFTKLKVKVREEVVTLKAGQFDIKNETAPALSADELEEWYKKNEDFVVLDLRNSYEIACGRFEKTVDPGLNNFRDLPNKLDKIKDLKDKKVVTVCTGGIRCEKATCLLRREGFSDVYQLKDGIHTYMNKYSDGNFKGTLFVFDNRMTTDVNNSKKDIIGVCELCGDKTENYCSDDRFRPSKKVLCCENCFSTQPGHIRRSSPQEI